MITSLIPSFNAGELSPLIHLRSDLEKYRSGCRTLENMLITPYGGVRRRPGLEYCDQLLGDCKLFSFQYSVDDAFVLVFTSVGFTGLGEPGSSFGYLNGGIRFYKNGSPIIVDNAPTWITGTFYPAGSYVVRSGVTYYCLDAHASGVFSTDLAAFKWRAQNQYQLLTPYFNHLQETMMCQINNVAYFTNPFFPPHKLVRIEDDEWEFLPVAWDYPPMLEENLDKSHTLEIIEISGGICSIGSSLPFFKEGMNGSIFEIKMERGFDDFDVSLVASLANNNATSPPLTIQGSWSFSTRGTWNGKFHIERSLDNGATWVKIREFKSTADANFTTGSKEPSRALLRIKYIHVAAPASTVVPKAVLETSDPFITSLVKIFNAGFLGQNLAGGVVITPIKLGKTSYWSEGAWSNERGFPRTATAHEQRLVFGGTSYRSQSLWASAVDDYENFERGTDDSNAWNHSLAANQQDSIQWMISNKQLLIGTSGGEWVMAATKDDGIITPTNVRARRHSGNGSKFIPPALAGGSVLFVQRGGRKIRDMAFSFEQDGYGTQDLTLLAEHIAGPGGIVATALQNQRDSVLWCVTANGQLIGMTYEKNQGMSGWARHVTGAGEDRFVAVTTIQRDSEEDEVWVAVRRVFGSSVRFNLERLRPDQFREQEDGDMHGLFFVDSGRSVTSETPFTELSGMSHLEGQSVQVVADGVPLLPRLVFGGKVTLNPSAFEGDPANATTITAGLPFVSTLEPMALEVGMQNGTSVSRQKRIHEVVIYFNQSRGCKISSKKSGLFDTIPFGEENELFTGAVTHMLDARHDMNASMVLKQDLPLPMTISAVVPKFNIYGDND